MFNLDIENLPEDKEVYKNIYASGNTDGVFQVESPGMKKMLKDFQPSGFEDLILAIAIYRPGPMKFIPNIVKVKKGEETPDYVIPEMDEVLGLTYGYPVYQEQIMQIFNKFAGFTLGEADTVRRYMSKKKIDKFTAYKDKFIDGLVAQGADREKATTFWEALVDFSKYAFNKSHAAAYAKVSYMTAYLKYYYPSQFIVATSNNVPFEKITNILLDGKKNGVTILPPDINKSDVNFTLENGAVRFGLSQIKGVASAATDIKNYRDNHGDILSVTDIINAKINKGALESLVDAGCLDFLYPTMNRSTILNIIERKKKELDDIIKYQTKIDEGNEILSILKKNETPTSSYKYYKSFDENKVSLAVSKTKALLTQAKKIYNNQDFECEIIEEKREDRLYKEKTALGLILTEKLLTGFAIPSRCTKISDINVGKYVSACGIITSSYVHTIKSGKSAGEEMLYLTIEDDTESLNCMMYASDYKKNTANISVGQPVVLSGSIKKDDKGFQMIIKSIEPLKESKKTYVIDVKNYLNIGLLEPYFQKYATDENDGIHITFASCDSILRDLDFSVKEDCFKEDIFKKFQINLI